MKQIDETGGHMMRDAAPSSYRAWRGELTADLRRRLADGALSGPKHARLQSAILDALAEGVLGPGDQLPPEPELADGVGLSLGTIRRCLMHLASDGVVSREHGRGTFIAGLTLTENEVWHMRFLEDDLKSVRPIFQRVISREVVRDGGAWAEFLGPSAKGFVRVCRAVNVDSLLVCHSDFYLSGDRFMEIMELDLHEIESVGLKHVMRLNFNVPIMQVQKVSQMLPTPEDISAVIGVAPGHVAQRLDIRSFSAENVPISYQIIWIPPTTVPLDLSGPASMATGLKGDR